MKQATSINNLITTISLAGVLTLTLAASQAVASFVDYDHSAEGVSQSASVYTGTPMKSGGFVDYDHSAEGASYGGMRPNSAKAPGMCGFLDCDHSSQATRS